MDDYYGLYKNISSTELPVECSVLIDVMSMVRWKGKNRSQPIKHWVTEIVSLQ